MALYQDWVDLYENQTQDSFRDFWNRYSAAETTIYRSILSDPSVKMKGTIGEQAEKLGVDKVLFMGFLDGINDSLRQKLNVEDMTEDSEFELDIDLEKLYFNMLDAKADYLYTLPEWDSILSEEKRAEITKSYRRSKTVVKEPKIGRNDPCPCGSGKKIQKMLREKSLIPQTAIRQKNSVSPRRRNAVFLSFLYFFLSSGLPETGASFRSLFPVPDSENPDQKQQDGHTSHAEISDIDSVHGCLRTVLFRGPFRHR